MGGRKSKAVVLGCGQLRRWLARGVASGADVKRGREAWGRGSSSIGGGGGSTARASPDLRRASMWRATIQANTGSHDLWPSSSPPPFFLSPSPAACDSCSSASSSYHGSAFGGPLYAIPFHTQPAPLATTCAQRHASLKRPLRWPFSCTPAASAFAFHHDSFANPGSQRQKKERIKRRRKERDKRYCSVPCCGLTGAE